MSCYSSSNVLSQDQINWLEEDNEKIILCDIQYYNPNRDSNNNVIGLKIGHFSNCPYIMDPDDSFNWENADGTIVPLTNVAYTDNLINIPDISSKIDSDVNIGSLEFLNAEGDYDNFITYGWEGHLMRLWIGSPSWSRGEFILILEGINSLISSPRPNVLALNIRDKKEVFETKVQSTLITPDYIRSIYNTEEYIFTDLATNNLARRSIGIKVTLKPNATIQDIATLTHAAIIENFEFTEDPNSGSDFANGNVVIAPILYNNFKSPSDSENSTATGFSLYINDTDNIAITITNPDVEGSLLGKYFHLYSPTTNYYVWYDVNFSNNVVGTDIAFNSGTPNTITVESTDEPTDFSSFIPYYDSENYPFQINVSGSTYNNGIYTIASVTSDTITLDSSSTLVTEVEGNNIVIERIEYPIATDPNLIEEFSTPFYPDFEDAWLPESIANTPVPICLGHVFNIEPVLIDSVNHVYLIHEGKVSSIENIRSNGVILSGELYEERPDLGCFRLLVHDNNTKITCDVIGTNIRGKDIDGHNLETRAEEIRESPGYEDFNIIFNSFTAPWLVEWIVLEKSSLVYTDLCVNTFNSDCSKGIQSTDTLGLYIKDETDISTILTDIMSSIGGYYRFARVCVLQLFQLKDPSLYTENNILELTTDDILEKGLSLAKTEPPKHSITLGYSKNWTVQDSGTLAGVLSDDPGDIGVNLVSLYSEEYSKVNVINDVLEVYPLAEITEVIPSLLCNLDTPISKLQAENEVQRRGSIRAKKRYVFKIEATSAPFSIGVGDIIRIIHPRFGFKYGKNALVISTKEYPTRQRVDLEVWL